MIRRYHQCIVYVVSLADETTTKNNTLPHGGLTQRAPEPRQSAPGLAWWESARFQAVCVASSWFRQSGVASSRPCYATGNASR